MDTRDNRGSLAWRMDGHGRCETSWAGWLGHGMSCFFAKSCRVKEGNLASLARILYVEWYGMAITRESKA